MILGLGSDIISNQRIEKLINQFGTKFLNRIFTAHELKQAENYGDLRRIGFFSKRFAAKEAVVKALGLGIRSGIRFIDIEVTNDINGRPSLKLTGKALEILQKLVPDGQQASIFLTLSDEKDMSLAVVIIEVIKLV